MSKKIIGITVGTQLPKPNFKQTDPTKGDYIKNKPDFEGLRSDVDDIKTLVGDTSVSDQIADALENGAVLITAQDLTEEQKAQVRNNISVKEDVADALLSLEFVKPISDDDGPLTENNETFLVVRNEDIFLPEVTEEDNGGVLIVENGKWTTGNIEVPEVNYPVISVNGQTGDVVIDIPSIDGLATESYVNTQIAAIPTPDVSGQINTHNTSTSAHNDIRDLISGLTTRLNALADSDDTTLDQMSEIVAYIKSNKSLIDSITTNKVNVADVINNLTTNVSNKPLSAAQGVALKALIDSLETDKLDTSALTEAINSALAQAKASGDFDGAKGTDGISATHSWSGTTLTITSASGTSSANLKGDKGDTPIRGTDYWTEADKAEIKSYVDEALPIPASEDNGKFLRVVNGVATWTAVPRAEEEVF